MRHRFPVTTALVAIAALAAPTVLAGSCKSSSKSSARRADIVDTAVSTGRFETLAAALGAAGLVDALRGDGPFTVFAPTDAAFAKLPHGTVEALLRPESRDRLMSILTYHVVPGALSARDVVGRTGAASLNGQRLTFAVDDHGVQVGSARVVDADVHAANGVVHAIDSVLLPSDADLVQTAVSSGSFGTLVTAVQAAGLDGVLAGDGPFTVFAPTDAAFEKLPHGTVASLLEPENRRQLVDLLKYHVVEGRVSADMALRATTAGTLSGPELRFTLADGRLRVNGAGVVANDIQATNGVIHVVDSVLLPR